MDGNVKRKFTYGKAMMLHIPHHYTKQPPNNPKFLETTVYSRLRSVTCRKLELCPRSRLPSSPPAWWCGCWGGSLDSSPEQEGFSSFWMSLFGSVGGMKR